MSKKLQRAIFSKLQPGDDVIVQDGIEMIAAKIHEVGTGAAKMFCTVWIDGHLREFYFEAIWVAN